jgi:hypothetical protein
VWVDPLNPETIPPLEICVDSVLPSESIQRELPVEDLFWLVY